MNQPLLLDAALSAELKRKGMQLALDVAVDWSESVMVEARCWLALQKARGIRSVTIEEFRSGAKNRPESHKAWGSLPKMLCKAGLIAPAHSADGERLYRRAAAPKTHSHPVALWTVL